MGEQQDNGHAISPRGKSQPPSRREVRRLDLRDDEASRTRNNCFFGGPKCFPGVSGMYGKSRVGGRQECALHDVAGVAGNRGLLYPNPYFMRALPQGGYQKSRCRSPVTIGVVRDFVEQRFAKTKRE